MPIIPRTSVIIPVRNGGRFVAEAIGSALAQLAPGDQIVVVDDASTDYTAAVGAAIPDRRIRIVTGSRQSVSSARTIGLAAEGGELIALLGHDDLCPPQRHALRRRPAIYRDTAATRPAARCRRKTASCG